MPTKLVQLTNLEFQIKPHWFLYTFRICLQCKIERIHSQTTTQCASEFRLFLNDSSSWFSLAFAKDLECVFSSCKNWRAMWEKMTLYRKVTFLKPMPLVGKIWRFWRSWELCTNFQYFLQLAVNELYILKTGYLHKVPEFVTS